MCLRIVFVFTFIVYYDYFKISIYIKTMYPLKQNFMPSLSNTKSSFFK
jgi:hypothetical protein